MTSKKQDFKFEIGQKVSGTKPGFGKVYGTITGRAELEFGTRLYWIHTESGAEFKLPEFRIHNNANEQH